MKIARATSTIDWALDIGDLGYSIALSTDLDFVFVSANVSSLLHFVKLDSADGTVIASY